MRHKKENALELISNTLRRHVIIVRSVLLRQCGKSKRGFEVNKKTKEVLESHLAGFLDETLKGLRGVAQKEIFNKESQELSGLPQATTEMEPCEFCGTVKSKGMVCLPSNANCRRRRNA
ncbi:hypothetical protein FH593_15230 [Leptospira interrogans]|uniref:hypothetical protein n=1 Tax=Leptospira interrogans TaxID=173 RepID=UPI001EF01568|nr:hypothetical protein [Leptospira interrogans]ULG87903.1 hypothetical protein FH593_15230 [Leptospira interrogans]